MPAADQVLLPTVQPEAAAWVQYELGLARGSFINISALLGFNVGGEWERLPMVDQQLRLVALEMKKRSLDRGQPVNPYRCPEECACRTGTIEDAIELTTGSWTARLTEAD